MNNYDKRELFKFLCLNKGYLDNFIIKNKCYVCNEIIKESDFEIGYTYWSAFAIPKHKKCSLRDDIIACQKIDADCNDCKFFIRYDSLCSKFNKKTEANSNFCSNKKCFTHRKE